MLVLNCNSEVKSLTVRGFQCQGSGGKTTHQASYQQLQVRHPRNGDVWQTQGSHSELVTPLVITAIRVEEELELRASVKCHLLK